MLRDKWLSPPACPSQGLILPILMPRDPSSLPRQRGVAAAAPSTSSEADTDTHGGHWHGWSQRQPQTRHCPQQHPYSGLTPDKDIGSHILSSSWAGGGRRSLTQHTHCTLQLHKHAHSRIPQAPGWSLCPLGTPVGIQNINWTERYQYKPQQGTAKFTVLYQVMR